MDTQQVMVHGWISQDGILEVGEKLNLPPGPVSVTVQAVLPPSGAKTHARYWRQFGRSERRTA